MTNYMLTNSKRMIQNAQKSNYAVAHVNINNLEWAKTLLQTVNEIKSPVIVGVSEGAIKYMGGLLTVKNLIEGLMRDLKVIVPVSLHLDHGSYDCVLEAIKVGFTSVMFDGSKLPFAENFKKTKKICEIASKKNVSVESEVGQIGGEEDGHIADGELANICEAKKMSSLNIFALAAGIGNIHGVYPKSWKGLNFDHLKKIVSSIDKGIVLHGGSGISNDQIKKSIQLGVVKINVNTELQLAFAQAIREYIQDNKDLDLEKKGYDPRKILKNPCVAMRNVIIEKIKLFGSYNVIKK